MTHAKLNRVFATTMPRPLDQNIALRRQMSAAVAKLRVSSDSAPERFVQARLTPIDERGNWKSSLVVDIKDFNERGITFHHQLPLSARRAMLVIESPQATRFTAEVDLTWCRFNRTGRYTSGGRFVQLVGKTA